MCVCVRVVFVSVDLKCSLDRERVDIEEKTFHMYDTNILATELRVEREIERDKSSRKTVLHTNF